MDSGAGINVFSGELARELGITLDDGEMLDVRAATGDEAAPWRHPVTITVGHAIPVLAAFGEAEHLEAVGRAGQEGFFDHRRL